MKRKLFSILTALALCLILLPGTAGAASGGAVTVTIGDTTLESNQKYVPDTTGVKLWTDEAAYLEYSDGTLTVHGSVAISGGMTVSGGTLTISGTDSDNFAVIGGMNLESSSTVSLVGGVDLTVENGISGGTLETEDEYKGNITLKAKDGPAVSGTNLNLHTYTGSAWVKITGNSSDALVACATVNIAANYVEIKNTGTGPALKCSECSITTKDEEHPYNREGLVTITSAGKEAIECPSAYMDIPGTYYDGSKLWRDRGTVEENVSYDSFGPREPGYCYTAGNGRIFWDYDGEFDPDEYSAYIGPATLTLENAEYADTIMLPYNPSNITIVPKGSNQIGTIMSPGPSVTVAKGDLDTFVIFTNASSSKFEVYGNVELPDSLPVEPGPGQGDEGITVTLTVMDGATLTIPAGKTLTFNELGEEYFKNEGKIVNKGTISIEGNAANAENISQAIKSLGLTGGGTVKVKTTDEDNNPVESTYTNSGAAVVEGDITLTAGQSTSGTGYTWDGSTLTLTDVAIMDTVTLPTGRKVTVVTVGNCSIQKLEFDSNSGVDLTFSGGGELTINSGIQGGNPADSLTVGGTAKVTFKGGIGLGEGGKGVVTVDGTLTIENEQENGYAIYTGNVIINSGGELSVSAPTGIQLACDGSSFNGAFTLKTNGTFTANCRGNAIVVFDALDYTSEALLPEGLDPKKVIVTPSGYLPAGHEPKLSDGGKSIVVAGGEEFTASIENVPEPEEPVQPVNPTPVPKPDEPVQPVNPAPSSGGGFSGGGYTGPTTYSVKVGTDGVEHGAVTVSPKNAEPGTTVTVTVTPDSGYALDGLTVTDSQGNEVKLDDKGGGKYTFTMPGRAVTVKAGFAPADKPCNGGAGCPSRAFADLDTGKWYHEAVDHVLQNGLMGGYGGGLFGPDDSITRAQFAQILYNKEGRPSTAGGVFADVPDGKWYTNAINWAEANDIVNGYGNGQFGPDDKITREQLAVMLWRYAGSPAAADTELRFTGADRISAYALEAMRWAVENGIINGYGNGLLAPQGTATRAQVAQMLKNFLESLGRDT